MPLSLARRPKIRVGETTRQYKPHKTKIIHLFVFMVVTNPDSDSCHIIHCSPAHLATTNHKTVYPRLCPSIDTCNSDNIDASDDVSQIFLPQDTQAGISLTTGCVYSTKLAVMTSWSYLYAFVPGYGAIAAGITQMEPMGRKQYTRATNYGH